MGCLIERLSHLLAFNLGVPHSYAQPPFVPFLPMAPSWQFPAPRTSTPMRESPALTCEPSSRPRTEFVAPSTPTQAPRSTPSAPVPRIRSRREAQRLLEEEQYLREEVEEGELDEDQDELEGIHEASGLDTSPEWELSMATASPPQGIAPIIWL